MFLSLGGMHRMGRRGVAYDNRLNSKLTDGIAIVIPGGTSLAVGKSGMLNTLIGVLILTCLVIGLDVYD